MMLLFPFILAKAENQAQVTHLPSKFAQTLSSDWIPAFAGMSGEINALNSGGLS